MPRNALSLYWPKNKISCKPTVYRKSLFFSLYFGGERGIRTPGTVARTPHFECGPIDHSGISPMTVPEKSAFRDCKYRQKNHYRAFFEEKNAKCRVGRPKPEFVDRNESHGKAGMRGSEARFGAETVRPAECVAGRRCRLRKCRARQKSERLAAHGKWCAKLKNWRIQQKMLPL